MNQGLMVFIVLIALFSVGFYLWDRRARRTAALHLWLLAIELDAYNEMFGDTSETFKNRWREEYGNAEDYV